MESVRLVIWDLDDTFWQGTLTEGGVAYSQQCHDIVVSLARRGITINPSATGAAPPPGSQTK